MERQKRLQGISLLFLGILHLVGLVGLCIPASRALFQALTPLHLLLSLGVLLMFHRGWSPGFVAALAFIGLGGWLVEYVGVHSGHPFGSYHYGGTLGWKAGGIPLVMAINWVLIMYLAAAAGKKIAVSPIWQAAAGAAIATLLDFFIEPVAIFQDFWQWQSQQVPLQNYLAWWGISFLFLCIFYRFAPKSNNPLALPLLAMQFTFFLLLAWLQA
ncbi:MAG: carotenoid biosynthesis protein [Bacteroidetes bacterium]|nr:MAG: carotenoid biosynthesis protein [Bacteroidota bacterium]